MTTMPEQFETGIVEQYKAMFEGKESTPNAIQPFIVIGTMIGLQMSQNAINTMYDYFSDRGYQRDKIDEDLALIGVN